jgi:hypothetical protein
VVEAYVYRNSRVPLRLENVGMSSRPRSKVIKLVRIDSKTAIIQIVLAANPVEGKSVLFVPSTGADKGFNGAG